MCLCNFEQLYPVLSQLPCAWSITLCFKSSALCLVSYPVLSQTQESALWLNVLLSDMLGYERETVVVPNFVVFNYIPVLHSLQKNIINCTVLSCYVHQVRFHIPSPFSKIHILSFKSSQFTTNTALHWIINIHFRFTYRHDTPHTSSE